MNPTRHLVLCLSVLGLFGISPAGISPAGGQDPLPDLELPPETPGTSVQNNGYLGMTVDLMAPEGKSVYIVAVVEGGPAATGGLKANDVIVEINRQAIGNLQDLDRAVRKPAGTRLEFKVRRSDVPQRFDVLLGTRPASPADSEPAVSELPPPVPPPAAASATPEAGTIVPGTEGGPSILRGSRPQLGIKVADAERLSDADKRRYGVEVESGAVISGITEGMPAAEAGLPLGGVVVSINGRRIGNAQDIVDLVQTFRPGQQIEVTYWEGDRMGRKNVRVGSAAVAVDTGTGSTRVTIPADPRALLHRRGGERPILDAVESILDSVLPPAGETRRAVDPVPPPPPAGAAAEPTELPAESMVPPPPPAARPDTTLDVPDIDLGRPAAELPAPDRPAAELPAPGSSANELDQLRKQAAEMQKQLETLLRKIEELEKNKATEPTG